MAKIEMKMPEEFLKLFGLAIKRMKLSPKCWKQAVKSFFQGKSNLSSVVGHGTKTKSRSTGELEDSRFVACEAETGRLQAG